MSILFEPNKLRDLKLRNRFIHSATAESMASPEGEVSDQIIKRYRRLARGEVGLIIPGYMYVHPHGRSMYYQTGIYSDKLIPGLQKLVDAIHDEGGRVAFQLAHGGRQTTRSLIGRKPMGPSSEGRDPMYFVKPKAMTETEIMDTIEAFAHAAERSVRAGADGIQLHAAHGYLINEFLSPFFNRRRDEWGGTDENRFRFLRKIILAVRKKIPEGMPILVKLNSNDFTPMVGITPVLAEKYAEWLSEMDVDLIEVSCGSVVYSIFKSMRGTVPVKSMVEGLPWWQRPLAKPVLKSMIGKFDLEEGYNLEAAKIIRKKSGKVSISVVGGFRRLEQMTAVVEEGYSDFISMSRPFIREPYLVKKFREGKKVIADCESCNECLAGIANNMPVRCHKNGSKNED